MESIHLFPSWPLAAPASPKAQPAGFPWEQAHLVAAEPSQLLHKKKSHLMDKLEPDVSATVNLAESGCI